MRNLNNFGKGAIIWLTTLFISSLVMGVMDGSGPAVVYFCLISVIFSAPAFIFFMIGFHFINKKNWTSRKKKMSLLFVNYFDIFFTFIFFIYTEKEFFLYYMLGVMVVSTIMILLLSFNESIENTDTPENSGL